MLDSLKMYDLRRVPLGAEVALPVASDVAAAAAAAAAAADLLLGSRFALDGPSDPTKDGTRGIAPRVWWICDDSRREKEVRL